MMSSKKRKADTVEVTEERAGKRHRRLDLNLDLVVNLNPEGGGWQEALLETEPDCVNEDKSRGSFAPHMKLI